VSPVKTGELSEMLYGGWLTWIQGTTY